MVWFGVLSRCHYQRRHNDRRLFYSVVCGFPRIIIARMETSVGITSIRVATFCVGLSASRLVASLSSCMLYIES